MGKAEIQYKLIKTLAFSPWIYTDKMLASELGVSQGTLKRSFSEMEIRGCIFTRDDQGCLFLQQTGWDGLTIKDATLRQMEILRYISAYPNGVRVAEINLRFNHSKDEKTIGRDLKELQHRQLITNHQGVYVVNSSLVIRYLAAINNGLIKTFNLSGIQGP